MRMIQYGTVDAMICGGTESCIDAVSIAGFCRLRALSTNYNDDPHLASRPFSKDRDGFVIGEGSCILVLEALDTVKKSNIIGEIIGYGSTCDAYHATKPHGKGQKRAMEKAL